MLTLTGRLEPACIPEAACVSGAVAGRPEAAYLIERLVQNAAYELWTFEPCG